MLAVHFGAGNIGRGFIGALLHESGYEVCFVDIQQPLIEAINDKKGYTIVDASDSKVESQIWHISGLNSAIYPDKVVEAIAQADLLTTAVGPNVLPHIADLVAKGLRQRITQTEKPLNVIACENLIGASALLKEQVIQRLSPGERVQVEQQVGFPNAAVDRIVPDQKHADPLMVVVEPFYEWVVEDSAIVGSKPPVQGITYVKELKPFIERKLFTVNTGHTVAAYLGYYYQHSTINEALKDSRIRQVVEGALHETGTLLVAKHGFNRAEHERYIYKIIQRFENPHITDDVTRVGRGPIRKLGKNDRLIAPTVQIIEYLHQQPKNLVQAIAATLLYDHQEDNEAKELQETILKKGIRSAIQQYTGLTKEHELIDMMILDYEAKRRRRI